MPKARVLLVIKEHESRNSPGCGNVLRVVQWILKDGASTVKLEKCGYYPRDGKRAYSYREGLMLQDLEALRPHWTQIVRWMKDPPPPPAEESEIIEEVPF